MAEFKTQLLDAANRRADAAEQRAVAAEQERDLWKNQAAALQQKYSLLKKRASEAEESAPKRAGSGSAGTGTQKHCSVCGEVKSACKDPKCQAKIAERKAAAAAKAK